MGVGVISLQGFPLCVSASAEGATPRGVPSSMFAECAVEEKHAVNESHAGGLPRYVMQVWRVEFPPPCLQTAPQPGMWQHTMYGRSGHGFQVWMG